MKIWNKVGILLFSFIMVGLTLTGTIEVSAAQTPYTTYTYSYEGDYQISPNAFTPTTVLNRFGEEIELNNPQDIVTDSQKNVYICDTGNNRVVLLNADLSLRTIISGITLADGSTAALSAPGGIFVDITGHLYIADTGNRRIVVLDSQLQTDRILEEPEGAAALSDFDYVPSAVCVDSLGRLYVLSKNTAGIMVMDSKGQFQGFIGAQSVSTDSLSLFWRMFMTTEQLKRSQQLIPLNYNNVAIDEDGFVYVTSYIDNANVLYTAIKQRSSAFAQAPIKKLTPSGVDVLKRTGFFPPVGDINFDKTIDKDHKKSYSALSEVAVRNNGIYNVVDGKYGKIFAYDDNGNLLYAFGGLGDTDGLFENLVSVAYQGTRLLALDSGRNNLTVFDITEYGSMIDQAVLLQKQWKYSESVDVWKQIQRENNNFDLAYLGIGKALLEQGKNKEALEMFKIISNTKYYSKAMGNIRDQALEKITPYLIVGIIVLLILLVKFFGFARKYNRKHQKLCGKRTIREELMYGFHLMVHPFDGFYDLKHEKRGSYRSATVILLLAVLSCIIRTVCSGFLFRNHAVGEEPDIVSILLNLLVPFFLWCAANWCLTSLMDGEGKFGDIYIASCYALIPIVLLFIPATILSNFLLLEEAMFVTYMINIAYFWTGCLLVLGTVVTHNYTFGKNILVCILSVIGIGIMLFIILLFFSVSGRLLSFVQNLFYELSFR